MGFQYKKVLLVGATAGIGAALADKFIAEGLSVIAVGRRQERLDAFVQKHGPEKASGIRFDITNRAGLAGFVNEVQTSHPDVDCVMLNSGTQSIVRLLRPAAEGGYDSDAWRNEIDTNFTSIVDVAQAFLPLLQQQASKGTPAAFIFTSAQIALIPNTMLSAYCASKAALSMYTYSLRRQLQTAGTGVRVVEIWPPLVQTELHDYLGEEGRTFGMPIEECINKIWAGLEAGEDSFGFGAPPAISEGQLKEFRDLRNNLADNMDNSPSLQKLKSQM